MTRRMYTSEVEGKRGRGQGHSRKGWRGGGVTVGFVYGAWTSNRCAYEHIR